MVKRYQIEDLGPRLTELLTDSEAGLSCVQISARLGINRLTMAKYLKVLESRGLIRGKRIGNTMLWFSEEGAWQYHFPDDYSTVQRRFSELITSFSQRQARMLIHSCLASGAQVPELSTEVILPSTHLVQNMYEEARIGAAERGLLLGIISGCIGLLDMHRSENIAKNVIVVTADSNSLVAEATAAAYRFRGWRVFPLGELTPATGALFDLDLERLFSRIWRPRTGLMLILIISDSGKGLEFLVDAVDAVKKKSSRKPFCAVLGPADDAIHVDMVSDDLHRILEWSENVSENKDG